MTIFVVILTLFSSLMHIYLTWAVSRLGWIAGATLQPAVWRGSLLLWLLFVVGVRAAFHPSGRLAVVFERFAFDWLGILFLATSVLWLYCSIRGSLTGRS